MVAQSVHFLATCLILVAACSVNGDTSSDLLLTENDLLLMRLSEMCPAALSTNPPYDSSKGNGYSWLNVTLTLGLIQFNGIDMTTSRYNLYLVETIIIKQFIKACPYWPMLNLSGRCHATSCAGTTIQNVQIHQALPWL